MGSALPEYVATFLGQLYFRRSYFFTLLHSNFFGTTVTFLEQLYVQNSRFLGELLQNNQFSEQMSSQFLRIRSSLRQLSFGTATFFADQLFRIKISIPELLFRSRYFCTASTFLEKLHFEKSWFFRKAIFCFNYFFWRVNFLERLLFQKMLPSIAATASEELLFHKVHFQKSYYLKATLPVHSYTSYLSVNN